MARTRETARQTRRRLRPPHCSGTAHPGRGSVARSSPRSSAVSCLGGRVVFREGNRGSSCYPTAWNGKAHFSLGTENDRGIITTDELSPRARLPDRQDFPMHDRFYRISRRKFLASAAALTLSGAGAEAAESSASFRARPPKPSADNRKPLAVLATVYRPLSHAYHIAGRFLNGYTLGGAFHVPRHYVRTLYVDQKPENDMSREIGRDFKVQVTRSIADALTQGGARLAVDGVLLIGEHGNYRRNDKGQVLYPRHAFLSQVVEVFRKTGQSVPVFNDKHLSYSWAQAKEMVGWSRELKFGLMAGSSLPVTWRRPELELKIDTPVEDALVAAYGPIEVYGFHALEALQVMLE